MIFEEKYFFCYILLPDQNFIVCMPLFRKVFGNMCFAIVFSPGSDKINFETNLIFLAKLFFLRPKSQNKKINIFRMKRAFKVKKMHFLSFLKGFQIEQFFSRRWKSDFKKTSLWTETIIWPLKIKHLFIVWGNWFFFETLQ